MNLDDASAPEWAMFSTGAAARLKSALNDYLIYLKGVSDGNLAISKRVDEILNLIDVNISEPGEKQVHQNWENYNFSKKALGFVLITLSQLQSDIKNCESLVVSYLYNKMNKEIEQASVTKKKHPL